MGRRAMNTQNNLASLFMLVVIKDKVPEYDRDVGL